MTVEQLDVRRWPTREPVAAARTPPFGWCHNPLLLRFYHDPDVWTLSFDEGDASGPDDAGACVSEEESLPSAFIHAHQEVLILHGGRYGLCDVYRIHNPDEPPEAWRWEKLACLGPEEVRERIMGDLRRGQGFDSLYRQVVERSERGGISDRMVRDRSSSAWGEEPTPMRNGYVSRRSRSRKDMSLVPTLERIGPHEW